MYGYKWILGITGFFIGRIPGAILGFAVGYLIDYLRQPESTASGGAPPSVDEDIVILTAALLKTKSQISEKEMAYYRSFISRYFGTVSLAEYTEKLRFYFTKRIDIDHFCENLRENHSYRSRLRIYEFLYGLAASDEEVNSREEQLLFHIARGFDLSKVHYENIRISYRNRFNYNEFYNRNQPRLGNISKCYTLLGVTEASSDSEVKAAYRKKVLQHHPDRNVFETEAAKKIAEETFSRITEAYDRIKLLRNIK